MINLNAINYEFPGDSFIIDKKTNELVSLSTGKQTSINIDNNESYRSVVGQRLISSPRQLFLGFSIGF